MADDSKDGEDGPRPRPGRGGERERTDPELTLRELHRGTHPGERYVRIVRPREFRRLGPGHLVARDSAHAPRSPLARALTRAKRALIGAPLATAEQSHERLSKLKALAVFSSDAISSSAYATEEILLVLVLAGQAALGLTLPISLAIAVLLAIVATSYRQTIRAYPQGGGTYIVSKDNLGVSPSLIAASSLLIGYLLTVAVSISAGVAALTSAFPELLPQRVVLAVGFLLLIMLGNLRGVRESGSIFAAPTYLFIISVGGLIMAGTLRLLTGDPPPQETPPAPLPVAEPLAAFLVLRAFASGCGALTGTEAIADGVPAFKEPQARNARITVTIMAAILGFLFLGISFLAVRFGIVPSSEETVLSQIAHVTVGDSPFYFIIQAATMLILVLAANTSFADFPRLAYFLARDRFLPHQFYFRGDRLAYSWGIGALGGLAGVLIVFFRAETHALIPLYAVGVFISFTLSQAGMVKRWWTRRESGWRRGLALNGIGTATTAVVAVILAITKFALGAWLILILIPSLVALLLGIRRHYLRVADQLELPPDAPTVLRPVEPTVIVPVSGLNRSVIQTLAYARAIARDVTALHVTDDPDEAADFRLQWQKWGGEVPLVILESPYRSLVTPILAYLDAVQLQHPDSPVTVVLSEFVPRHWWEYLLHNQSALRLKTALFFRPNTVVANIPHHLQY